MLDYCVPTALSEQALQPIVQEKGVRIHDLFGLVDSRHHALEGSPAHPLWFYHVIADPTLCAELAPELESTAQSSLMGRFTLAGVREPVGPA
jgi:hypothetical protein